MSSMRSWSKSPPPPMMERRASSMQTGGTIQSQIDHVVTNEANSSWFAPRENRAATKSEVQDVLGALTIDETFESEATQAGKASPAVVPSPKAQGEERSNSPPTPRDPDRSNGPTPSPTPPRMPVSAGPTPFAAMGSSHPPLSPGPRISPGPPPSPLPSTTRTLNHLATPFSSMSAANEPCFGTPTANSSAFAMSRALTEIPEASFFQQPVKQRSVSFENVLFRWRRCERFL